MIKVSDFKRICGYMSTFLYYGVFHHYSLNYIEERISHSHFADELEGSRNDFLYEDNEITLLKDIYALEDIDLEHLNETNSLFLWVGEAYIRLFFKFHKTFFYLFLYFPLGKMMDLYNLYHEQDWTQLYRYYQELYQNTSLLKMLVKKRGLSISKLSIITGISQNTLNYYALDDRHLYEAKYIYIDALSHALDVDSKIFLPCIHNYLDTSDYDFDRNNTEFRGYLGLYIVSYFSSDIKNRGYVYDKKKNTFFCSKGSLIVTETVSRGYIETNDINPEVEMAVKKISEHTNMEERKNIVLIIFEYNMISKSAKAYAHLKEYGYESIYIINQECVICIKDNYWSTYLSKKVDDLLKEKVKNLTGDFAI